MLASGTVEDLIGTSSSYRVAVADPDRAETLLRDAGYVVEQRDRLLCVPSEEDSSPITRVLAAAGLHLDALVPQHAALASVFLQLPADSTPCPAPHSAARTP